MKILMAFFMGLIFNSAFASTDVGGGGNTIPDAIGQEAVSKLLPELRQYLYVHLQLYGRAPSPVVEPTQKPIPLDSPIWKVFSGRRTIYDVIADTKIYDEKAKPCLDANGKEVDGSSLSPVPNTICVSSFRLGRKLNEFIYREQTLALLGHEYSHLLGLNEAEATDVQKLILSAFGEYGPTFYTLKQCLAETQVFLKKRFPEMRKIQFALTDLVSKFDTLKNREIYESIERDTYRDLISRHTHWGYYFNYINIMPHWILTPRHMGISLVRYNNKSGNSEEYHYLRAQLLRFNNLIMGAGYLAGESVPGKLYKKGFGNNKVIDIKDFLRNLDPDLILSSVAPMQIERIETREDLRKELNQHLDFFKQFDREFLKIEKLSQP